MDRSLGRDVRGVCFVCRDRRDSRVMEDSRVGNLGIRDWIDWK